MALLCAARSLGEINPVPALRVLWGPFAGLRYVPESAGSALIPKLLGCYEQELRLVLEALIRGKPRHIVNIGCAEGYYAVGLAWRLPKAEVGAYNSDSRAREFCARLARLNGVEARVRITA